LTGARARTGDDASIGMVALHSLPENDSKQRLSALVRITAADGTLVCDRCEVADRALKRMRGLLGRRGLDPGAGMLITPAPSVMTFFMRFPVDVVFLDRDRRIVGISHTLRPWRVAGARRALSALELPAGTAEEKGLEKGDLLAIAPAAS
jgi:uncharacterized membrane protein (UPF0127 family)